VALPKAVDNGITLAAKSVVTVMTSDGHGSGCIISGDGYIVTNAHVVGEEETVKVLLADGVEVKGKVVRVNPDMDLALIKVDTDGLNAFQLPSANAAEIGADVFAIGTPADKELGQSISKGIISGRRKIDGHALLQTDVSINGGNSGGALVGRSGQLLGIVNAKLVGRGIEGIGFAIPAEQVTEALQLKFID
jgi:S1-C subfamily serine protease